MGIAEKIDHESANNHEWHSYRPMTQEDQNSRDDGGDSDIDKTVASYSHASLPRDSISIIFDFPMLLAGRRRRKTPCA